MTVMLHGKGATCAKIQELFSDVPPDELEREISQAVAEVRAEMKAEREAARRS